MSDDAPEPEAARAKPEPISLERPRRGFVATTLGLLVGLAWNGATAWAASSAGRLIAEDAGMPSRALRIETVPLLIAGLVGGLLLRVRPEAPDRVVPFVALAVGAATGLAIATHGAYETAVRWPIFVAPAAWAAFSPAVFRR